MWVIDSRTFIYLACTMLLSNDYKWYHALTLAVIIPQCQNTLTFKRVVYTETLDTGLLLLSFLGYRSRHFIVDSYLIKGINLIVWYCFSLERVGWFLFKYWFFYIGFQNAHHVNFFRTCSRYEVLQQHSRICFFYRKSLWKLRLSSQNQHNNYDKLFLVFILIFIMSNILFKGKSISRTNWKLKVLKTQNMGLVICMYCWIKLNWGLFTITSLVRHSVALIHRGGPRFYEGVIFDILQVYLFIDTNP